MSNSLRRKILKGDKYDALMPKVFCEMEYIGKGDTDFSVSKMKDGVELFNYQTMEIAMLLQADSLNELCANVHYFCFNHFDYDADNDDQMLRSPACSWYHRYKGIDCKSYSIIASCILTNLGVNHFIRKVAYKEPGKFTHVYVIIPINQSVKDWRNLGDYYMIDGTINTSNEIDFIEARDEFMSGMPHYYLNGPAPYQTQLNGIGDIAAIAQSVLGSIKNVLASVSCIGGSWYNKAQQEATHNAIIGYVTQKVTDINTSVTNKNWAKLSTDIQDLIGVIKSADANFSIKKGEGWNYCTTKNLEDTDKFLEFLSTKVLGQTLTAWMNQYFTVAPNGFSKTYNCNDFDYNLGFVGCYVGNPDVQTIQGLSFTPKDVAIKAFEINEFTNSMANGYEFNTTSFINSLDTILVAYSNISGNGNSNDGEFGGEYYTDQDLPEGEQKKSGFGTVATVLVGLVALGLIFSKDSTNPKTKKDE